MARSALAWLIAAAAFGQTDAALKQAGVCSRCHVAQVLEWSASRHTRTATVCQSCHGPSAAHIANERNQIKPDRPQPACATCHAQGCPKTKQTAGCQTCHHQHALVNPNDRSMPRLGEDATHEALNRELAAGEAHAKQGNWAAARDAFARAVKLDANHRRARNRLRMAERRLNPAIPGATIIGAAFDPESGLPRHIRVQGIDFLLVPAADADIGSDRFPSSQPVHTVPLQAFYLARTELTVEEWEQRPPALGSLPVRNVSWDDAVAWMAKRNAGFRLPTEAEWEHASRGAPDLEAEAWYRGNTLIASPAAFHESDAYAPRPAANRRANAQGFHDMLGNVAEWCSSQYQPYPFRESNGPGLRVLRGGSFLDSPDVLDPAFRHAERPSRRNPTNGLRLAWSAPR